LLTPSHTIRPITLSTGASCLKIFRHRTGLSSFKVKRQKNNFYKIRRAVVENIEKLIFVKKNRLLELRCVARIVAGIGTLLPTSGNCL
jgi:hypothetical protein